MEQAHHSILHPLTREQLFSDHWEKSPLHIERSDTNYFQHLLSITAIEDLLSCASQYFPDVQLVNSSADIAVSEYTDANRKIINTGLWSHYRDGATLIISGADRRFSRVADLCRKVSVEFGMRSQANAYLSPGSQQGFNPHYDTHDVFVLQVSGSKKFRFYPSDIELPFTQDTFPADYPVDNNVQETVTMSAGDTLYIPRGVVHDAVAQGTDPSLHITLGVYPVVVRDVLQEMIQVVAENNPGFRRTIDLKTSITGDQLQSIFDRLHKAMDDELYRQACSRLSDEVAIGLTAGCKDQLSNNQIAESSTVCINQEVIISVEQVGSLVKLRVPGQVLEFDGVLAAAVLELMQKKKMRANGFATLSGDQNIALLNQLLSVNCIRVVLDGQN